MRIGRSYKQHPVSGSWDAIVVGSGLGGLATASLLARHAGKRVLVLEKHYTAGGFTHTFTRPGYEWDVGVHYVGDVHRPHTVMRKAFDHLTDGTLEWADMGEVYDKIVIAGDTYDLVRGREGFRARMKEYFPKDAAAIDRYLERLRETVGRSRKFFLEKALPGPVAKLAGGVLRYSAMKDARQTVRQVLSEITSNERLIGVLTAQYGDYGLPPSQASWFMHAILCSHYLGGGAYPVGGSARIAETILPGIEARGGAVVTNAEVAEILLDKGRAIGVRLVDGNELRAPIVISDAGWALTFQHLVPRQAVQKAGLHPHLPDVAPSLAHVSLYVGAKATAAELGLQPANQWIYPHHDHDANIRNYLADPSAPLPVAYLSFPSAKDPDFLRRYPGRATCEVIGLAPYEWFGKWEETRWKKRGQDYEAFKQQLADRLQAVLVDRCPGLAGKIDHAELSTPLSTKNFVGHPRGEIYGLAHTPERFARRELRPETPIAGLFLTGADICTAGVGGALMGGVLAASAVSKKNLLGEVLKR